MEEKVDKDQKAIGYHNRSGNISKLASIKKIGLKKGLGILGLFIALIALPIVMTQLGNQQDTRQNASAPAAAGTGDTKIYLTPATSANFPKGAAFDVQLKIDTKGKSVLNLTTELIFDTSKFTYVSFDKNAAAFDSVLTNPISAGRLRILAETPPTTPASTDVVVATLHFTATNTLGTGTMSFAATPLEVIGKSTTGAIVTLTAEVPSNTYNITDSQDPNLDTTLTPPTNLQPVGAISPGMATLSWTASDKSTGGYFIRITDTSIPNMTDMTSDCADQSPTNTLPTSGGVCRIVATGTSYQYNFLAGHNYTWFVHTRSSAGKYGPSTPMNNLSVSGTTANATPTPTPTPIPVNLCTATHNKPLNCTCEVNTDCRSTLCSTDKKCAPKPTIPVTSGSTGLKLSVGVPGVGPKLDSNFDNPTPVNSSRIASVQLFDSTNTSTHSGQIPLNFNLSTGKFEGNVNYGTNIPTGDYTLKIHLDNTLIKSVPGIVKIIQAKADNTASSVMLVPGDLNSDSSLGIIDWTFMIACIKNETACTPDVRALADLQDNGIVDEYDVQILQRGFAIRTSE